MPDISHDYGADITVSANGDILVSESLSLSQQMVLRRLLTARGAYIWHPEYGAGLPALVGQPLDVATAKSLIYSQMALEETVVQVPSPEIEVYSIPNGMYVYIKYIEKDTNKEQVLSFNIKQ